MGHAEVPQDEYTEVWASATRDLLWQPKGARFTRAAGASAAEKCEGLAAEFDAARGAMEKEAHRAAKLEKKAGVVITVGFGGFGSGGEGLLRGVRGLLGWGCARADTYTTLTNPTPLAPAPALQGLQQRDAKQRAAAEELAQSLADAQIELACFKALQARESAAIPQRADAMRALVAAQKAREGELQERFKELGRARDDALEALRAAARAAAGQQQQQQQARAAAG
jgi:hypothetical protein